VLIERSGSSQKIHIGGVDKRNDTSVWSPGVNGTGVLLP